MSDLIERLQSTLGSGYRVTRELGGGGMSRVFAAEETELDRQVVVKVLPPDLGAGLNVERFRREIQLAAKLQHPHIVPLLAAGAKDGLLYYTMPHIDGDSLRVKISRSGEMPIPDAIRVMRDVADALEYAHEHGVVHRDIKPENVLLSGHHALVTDFGVSKALASSTGQQSLTSMGVALGTPTYMSPEQATADPNVDHRTDIYALGILGYELIAGRPPFSGNTPQQVLAAQVTQQPEDIRRQRPNMPAQLANLIMRALEKKPGDRWQSAHEMRLQLESLGTPSGGTMPYQAISPIGGHDSGITSAIRKRPIASVAAAAVAIVLLAAVALGAKAMFGGGSREAPFTVGTAHQLTNDPGIEVTPALSPDGKLLAYAGGTPWLTRIYVRQISGGNPVEVAASLRGEQRGPAWSPDGSQLAFRGVGGLFVVPALGGVPRLLVRGAITSPAWSHDGKSIAYSRAVREILVANVDGTGEKKILDADSPHSIAWSPDDSYLAIVAGNETYVYSRTQFANIAPSAIWVIARGGGAVHKITDSRYLRSTPVWTPDGRGLLFVSNEQGGRDVYFQHLTRGREADGIPARLTTGLNVHGISLSADGTRLAYSALSSNVGVWMLPIPTHEVSVATAHAVTSANERIEDPSISPDGKWIAFDSDRGGMSHVYRVPTSGTGVEQITSGTENEFNPQWSRDGSQISYQTWVDGYRDSYATPVAGFAPRLIMGGGKSHEYAGHWSPDGSQLAVPSNRTGRYELYLVPSRGGTPRQLTTTGATSANEWSPDGRYIAYVLRGQILVISPSGGAPQIVANKPVLDSGAFGSWLPWSTDSRTVYVRVYDSRGNENIGAIDVDPAKLLPLSDSLTRTTGANARILVRFDKSDMPSYRQEFSTDGRNFVFTIGKHEADIWVMDLVKK